MSEWKEVALADIVKIKGGKRLPKGETLQTEPTNHPYIRVRDMGTRYINRNVLEFVPNEVFDKISRYTVNTGDIIISIVGTIGLISIIDDNLNYASQTENCAKLSGLNQNDTLYLYYFLKSKTGQQRIYQGTVGAVQAKLPLYSINALQVIWPSKNQRSSIAHILGKLDDKIELNRKMNQTLEEMAQALFKSWFVDFDPVFDKALAAGNEIPEALTAKAERRKLVPDEKKLIHKNPELAKLFPSQFTFNETLDKWIPEGWEVKSLRDISDVISKGTTPRKDDVVGLEETVPFIKVRDIDDQGNLSSDLDLIPMQVHVKQLKRSILKEGDLLFSIAGTIGRVSKIPKSLENSNCNQAVAFIRLENKNLHNYLVHLNLRSNHIQNEIDSKIVQAVQANASLKNISDLSIILPKQTVLDAFNQLIKELSGRIELNKNNLQSLTQLRDTLLPQLISGKVRVPEAFVEEMAD